MTKIAKKVILEKTDIYNKLPAVKLIKIITDLDLKSSKNIIDKLNNNNKIEFEIYTDLSDNEIISEFKKCGYNAIIIDRKKKLNRILYFNKKTLINDMLLDILNWEKIIKKQDLETMTYIECKNLAITKIIKKYEKYFETDFFQTIINDINQFNNLEETELIYMFIKFNKYFNKLNTKIINIKNIKNKSKDYDDLIDIMSNTLHMLISIYNKINIETNISFNEILKKIISNIKIKKQF